MDGLESATSELKAPHPLLHSLQHFVFWVLSFALPGLGMFSEAYFIFSVGNLKPLFTAEFPGCWKTYTTCDKALTHSITHTQVGGIMAGQLGLGFAADQLGRKLGSIITAGIMCVFGILLAASSGSSDSQLFTMFTVVQFFFGCGVGGEYPVASASANEHAEKSTTLKNRRGETVVLVFSMQGWGNLVNTLVLMVLVAAFGQSHPNASGNYDPSKLNVIWRLSYALGLIPLAFILWFRVFRLKESKVWAQRRAALKEQGIKARLSGQTVKQLIKHYWHRQFATAMCWFVCDFAFYGNKLFQSSFIAAILGGKPTILQTLEWTALNSSIALTGYYFAAFTIDRHWMGRMRMQAMGFLWMFILFTVCWAQYDNLIQPGRIKLFQALYYLTSFWGQFGPNATTWLLPAELFPTETRAMHHGISAAVGKAGALTAGVVFGYVSDKARFGISGWCGLIGTVLTLLFIPDITGLNLEEGDKRWAAVVERQAYTGEAINPRHLSLFERALGYGKPYKPPEAGRPEKYEVVSHSAFTTRHLHSRPSLRRYSEELGAASGYHPKELMTHLAVGLVGSNHHITGPQPGLWRAAMRRVRGGHMPTAPLSLTPMSASAAETQPPGSQQLATAGQIMSSSSMAV